MNTIEWWIHARNTRRFPKCNCSADLNQIWSKPLNYINDTMLPTTIYVINWLFLNSPLQLGQGNTEAGVHESIAVKIRNAKMENLFPRWFFWQNILIHFLTNYLQPHWDFCSWRSNWSIWIKVRHFIINEITSRSSATGSCFEQARISKSTGHARCLLPFFRLMK